MAGVWPGNFMKNTRKPRTAVPAEAIARFADQGRTYHGSSPTAAE